MNVHIYRYNEYVNVLIESKNWREETSYVDKDKDVPKDSCNVGSSNANAF